MAQKIANLIGLAGQSCAGKNVVAQLLAQKGYAVIDADVVAHTVLEEHREEVIARFTPSAEKRGIKLSTGAGLLDRMALGTLLFSDEHLLAEHESFILPYIEENIRCRIQTFLIKTPHRPIVLNAPTLHKTSLTAACAFILYIKAPFLLRLIRGRKRDGVSFAHLMRRFLRQRDFFAQYLVQNADIVSVLNARSVYSLRRKIERILREKGF